MLSPQKLCTEDSVLVLLFFADSGCFLVALVAEVGLENSIDIFSSYLPVTSGFKQIKTFIWIMCRSKTQPAVETRADEIYLGYSPQCRLSMPFPTVSPCFLLVEGLSTVMVRASSFCQQNNLALPACDLSQNQLQCWGLFYT